jgi:hypothetical protein
MLTMLVNNPLVEQLDLSCMRVLSCGGSPQSPAVLTRAIAVRIYVSCLSCVLACLLAVSWAAHMHAGLLWA